MEIKEKARTYANKLFPSILWIIESPYDYQYGKEIKLSNPNEVFPNVRLDIVFESFTHPQKTFLFELLDKRFDVFMNRKWYDFNSLTTRVFKENFKSMKIPEELEFLSSKEFLKATENIIEEKRNKIAEMYLQMRSELIDEVFADIEPSQDIEEPDDTNRLYNILDDVRRKDHSYLELYSIIKKETELDPVALQYLYKDIEIYAFSAKEMHEATFLPDEVDAALKKLRDNGKSTEDLIKEGYLRESLLIDKNKQKQPTYIIDYEKLLFPFEFYSIYDMLRIIKKELDKHQGATNSDATSKVNLDKLKVNLSVPQLAFLFKMINDLKPSIFNLKSEAELHRFISANFQTKSSDPEKGISENKLRILFNSPDPKAAEFWEKHIRTIQAEIKNLK
ncbi:hypothetical protein [Marixanthotalea marina]|uniref:hypothetical protein n=1 Tax=Marixanthotalea marina TaxID=2844359 RepID=UPI002989AAF8|nr:hypothetical protein [Marixanthotalea marina]